MNEIWTCARCGQTIGVYEPMVVVDGGHERTTSRLLKAHRDLPGAHYHEACRTDRERPGA